MGFFLFLVHEKVEALNERLEKESFSIDKQNDFIDLESASSKSNFAKSKSE